MIVFDTTSTSGGFLNKGIIDKDLALGFTDSSAIAYSIWNEPDPAKVLPFAKQRMLNTNNGFTFWEAEITQKKKRTIRIKTSFDFIKTNEGFMLYRCNQTQNSICWQ